MLVSIRFRDQRRRPITLRRKLSVKTQLSDQIRGFFFEISRRDPHVRLELHGPNMTSSCVRRQYFIKNELKRINIFSSVFIKKYLSETRSNNINSLSGKMSQIMIN